MGESRVRYALRPNQIEIDAHEPRNGSQSAKTLKRDQASFHDFIRVFS